MELTDKYFGSCERCIKLILTSDVLKSYFSSLDRIVSESVGVKKANTELGIAIFICLKNSNIYSNSYQVPNDPR